MAIDLQPIHYEADGLGFTGYLADGSSGGRRAPGILVIHEGPGLGLHTLERAERLAGLGFVALAMDLYGEVDPPMERARELAKGLRADLPGLRARCRAALDALAAQPGTDPARLAAIGYCFGGAAAIELARGGAPLACIAGFHAGFIDTAPAEDDRAIRGKVLICQGADDPIVPAGQRDAFAARMKAAGVDWQLHLYGGVGHSFTNRDIDAYGIPGFAYHEIADRRAWAAMLGLFEEVF